MDFSRIKSLRDLITGVWVSQAIYVAAKLGVADQVADGPKSVGELAAATGSDPDALYRVLRAVASVGVFTEIEPRRFATTELARGLETDVPGSIRHLTIWYGEDVFRAWTEALYSVRTGKPAFEHIWGVTMWEHFARDAESRQNFNIGMGASRWQDQLPLVGAFDFQGIRRLVDVGGGQGSMLAAILSANPRMEGVLVDLPSALEGASELLESAGVEDRCRIVAGSGMDPLPSGDAYLLSSVLHAMDNERALSILSRIRDAAEPGGRVLVIERVLPSGDQAHFGKILDLIMLLMNGGRERTEDEFRSLFAQSGFLHTRTVELPAFVAGVGLSIIEGVAAK